MYKKIIGLLIILTFFESFSQEGFPTIVNFEKKEYKAGRQNWDIDIDNEGIVYFGNSEGLLYNVFGEWGFKTMSKSGDIRSVFVQRDTIWCGGNEFGYFIKKDGDFSFKSLGETDGGPVWNIEAIDNNILFQSERQLINYSTKDKIITSEYFSKIDAMAKWDSTIWLALNNGELGYLKKLEFFSIGNFKLLKNREVRKMFVYNDLLYLVMLDGNLLSFNGDSIAKVALPEQLLGKNLFTGINYNENSFCLGTVSEGLIQVDNKGTVLAQINSKKGLLDDTILSIKQDAKGDIWLGLDYGIAKIELGSSVRTIYSGATTFDILDYNKKTYLATNKGLFEASIKNNFKLIEKTVGQVWKLKIINNELYICHNRGLFRLKDNQLRQETTFGGVLDIAHFKNTNYYLFSTYNGLLLVKKEGENFKNIRNLDPRARPKLVYDNLNTCIWLEIKNDKVYKLKIKENSALEKQEFPKIKKVFETKIGLFFSDDVAFFKYQDKKFIKTTNPLLEDLNGQVEKLDFNSEGSSMAYVKNGQINHLTLLSDGNMYSYGPSLKLLSNNLVKGSEFLKFKNNKLYIAQDRGMKIFDYNYRYNVKNDYQPKIASLTILNDSNKKYYLPDVEKSLFFTAGNKDINFQFNAKKSSYDFTEYRYRLAPKEIKWSNWNADKQNALYSYLEGGKYVFQLQSRVNGGKSKETSVNFEIDKRWYQTSIIYILYFLIFLMLIFSTVILMNRLNKKKLTQQKNIYKQEKMEGNLVSKNQQLLQYTEIISHKNEFLNRIKDGLETLKDPKVKRWVNIISKEVNTEKKDFLFHKLFSEIHQDFISRITEVYPLLTSNDIRMLSYIRINLEKKEISNLMNISQRSIDMSRYRLRKKLNIDKSLDLNTFIRNF